MRTISNWGYAKKRKKSERKEEKEKENIKGGKKKGETEKAVVDPGSEDGDDESGSQLEAAEADETGGAVKVSSQWNLRNLGL